MLLKEFSEKWLVREVERNTHLLNCVGTWSQHHFSRKNHISIDPRACSASTHGFYHSRKVFRRDAEFVGIKLYRAFLAEIVFEKGKEIEEKVRREMIEKEVREELEKERMEKTEKKED